MLKRLGREEDGNIAVLFALGAFPLLAAVGAAVDYSRAANLQSQLQADTDAAALAACKDTVHTAELDLKKVAQDVLTGFMPNRTVSITKFKATNNPRTVELTSRVSYPPQFMRIVGDMPISTTANCALGEKFYEIALVLDTTGSMSKSAGSTSKIEALKKAATTFVNTMFTSIDSDHLRMSIVPFAAMVKVDPNVYGPGGSSAANWLDTGATSTLHWQNVTNRGNAGFTLTNRFSLFTQLKSAKSSWGWAGCVESLPYPQNTRDDSPSSAANTLYQPSFAPDEIGTMTTYSMGWFSYTAPDFNSTNSYMDDGTSATSSNACYNQNSTQSTRLGQACKYKTPTKVQINQDGPNAGCTSNAITPLTNSKTTLTSAISALSALGSTNIHQGVHWGWRTISPNGVFSGPAAYNAANTTKIIVLMTDGVNQWITNQEASDTDPYTKSYYSAYGYLKNADGTTANNRLPPGNANPTNGDQTRAAIDQLARETCTNAKARGVIVYSVAFSTPNDAIDATGQQLIKDCASGSEKYFLASDSTSLDSTFAAIAQGIGDLRLTK